MTERKGTISVHTADIFPIIKKWLYSEHDIFLRELVANATDAITKRATYARTLNQEIPTGSITVGVDKSKKIITISDNGIGMSEEEVEKYIAQLAFSGAEEFVQNMKKVESENGADIIGKFGLGFYSSFMVADKVEVETLSMTEGAKPTKWTCEGETDYVFSESTKSEVGTTITLYINEENTEFLSEFKLSDTLKKFCDFMPYSIGVIDWEKKAEKPKKEDGTIDESAEAVAPAPSIINNTEPLWRQDPTTLKDEDYINFYRELYPMDPEPLFWLHLKVDHPFTLEGILYFPKINQKMAFKENNIKLYSRQVFVSDNVKNVIPDFLSLLKGTIDSTDIPLNVSRSSLQGDPNIRRISNYVVKKVAEALKKLFKNNREKYEQVWADSGMFVKYGCVSDPKFDELMRDRIVFKNTSEQYMTLPEYFESVPENFKEKLKDKVLYIEQGKSSGQLRQELLEAGIQSLEMDDHIDPHFMQHVESKKQGDQQISFASVDSEYGNIFEGETTNEEDIKVKELFEGLIKTEITEETERPEVEIQKNATGLTCAYYKVDEQMKRFAKMAQSMGQNQTFPIKKTLVINPANGLIKNALKIHEKGGHENLVNQMCQHVQDLAGIASEGLKEEKRNQFLKRSQDLVQELSNLVL